MPIINTDTRGKFAPFISDNSNYLDYNSPQVLEYPYYDPVELGLEKPLSTNPLKVEAGLQLYAKGVSRYTGEGETVATGLKSKPHLIKRIFTIYSKHKSQSLRARKS